MAPRSRLLVGGLAAFWLFSFGPAYGRAAALSEGLAEGLAEGPAEGLASAEASASVGMAISIRDLVLPGTELRVKPIGLEDPIVVRIVAIAPHGTSLRYDLVCYGLEPGTFDLTDWLERVDGSATEDLPATPVEIVSVLPAGWTKPSPPDPQQVSGLGGYLALLVAGGLLWLAVLAAVIVVLRRRRAVAVDAGAPDRPLTLAERLRPMVRAALSGTLPQRQQADLELTLMAYWRRRLGLNELTPSKTLEVLKQHEQAGPLLVALEAWLHRPKQGEQDRREALEPEIERLLEPYRELPAEALEDQEPIEDRIA